MIDLTTRPARKGSLFLEGEEPVRRPELYLVLYDPEAPDTQAALALPASLLKKLWPETAGTLSELEGRLREFGL